MNRTISISLEQAKEWVRSDNKTLQTLALKAFNKAELGLVTYQTCANYVSRDTYGEIAMFNVINTKLAIVASYLNNLFPSTDESRYFISGIYDRIGVEYHNFGILNHKSVKYMGIIYFNTLEAAKIAIDLLYDDLEGYKSI